VRKFDAPKATLMSYIIKGILDRHLPWGLVLFGVMIAVVLEMCGIPSLRSRSRLSASFIVDPIFAGPGPWLVDRTRRREMPRR
jgi:uncharacterized oligopeptide transporter (OPT) family protein